jgi:16S rRNA (guanine527-N7)-methyltransferase
MLKMKEFLQQALTKNQYDISAEIQDNFLAYLELMKKWNTVHNLTAILDPQEMVMLHILDSLSVNRFLHGNRIVDVGTGAGLPGIPLALIFPEKEFFLLDSNNKKTLFLNQVVFELKLKNVHVVHSRVEAFRPEKCFDSVITRAFSSLTDMLQGTKHLLCADGHFLAMKGQYPEQEIQNVPDEFRVLDIHALKVNGLHAERHLVCIEKAYS